MEEISRSFNADLRDVLEGKKIMIEEKKTPTMKDIRKTIFPQLKKSAFLHWKVQ